MTDQEIQEAVDCCKKFLTCSHFLTGKKGDHPRKLAVDWCQKVEELKQWDRKHLEEFNRRVRAEARLDAAEKVIDRLRQHDNDPNTFCAVCRKVLIEYDKGQNQ